MEAGINVVVKGISAAEAAKFETLFRLLDNEGTGTINEDELADLMPRMGVFLSEQELHLLFQSVDIDGSGGIDFPEFLQLMSRHREANQLTLLEGGRACFKDLRQASRTKYVLRSDDPANWVFDLLVMCVVVFFAGTVLYEDVKQEDIVLGAELKVLGSVVLVLDMARKAVTSLPPDDSDTLPVDSLQFAVRQYVRSRRCVVDLVSAFPLDLIFLVVGQDDAMRAAQHLRLAKVLAISELFRLSARDILSPTYARFHFGVVPLIRIMFWAAIVVHVLSMVWILISPGEVPYIEAVYFVMYTLTTTGYGDITVETDLQRVFAVFLFCCASVVTGLVVGKLVQFSQQADLQTDSYKRMLETLAALNHLTIPQDFKEEVLAFQLHRLKHSNSLFNDAISGLPQVMQDRMALYARMKIVRQVPIFSNAPEICVAKLAQSLINVVVPPEEYIVIAGEEGEEMFFLFHGMCAVWLPALGTGKWIATIKRGGVFGEVALLQETRRSASIKSLTYCQLFRLDKAAFSNIVDNFPALLDSIQSVSVALNTKLAKEGKEEVDNGDNSKCMVNHDDQYKRKRTLELTIQNGKSSSSMVLEAGLRDDDSESDSDSDESVGVFEVLQVRSLDKNRNKSINRYVCVNVHRCSLGSVSPRAGRRFSYAGGKQWMGWKEEDVGAPAVAKLLGNVEALLGELEETVGASGAVASASASPRSPVDPNHLRSPANRSVNTTLHTLSQSHTKLPSTPPRPTGAW